MNLQFRPWCAGWLRAYQSGMVIAILWLVIGFLAPPAAQRPVHLLILFLAFAGGAIGLWVSEILWREIPGHRAMGSPLSRLALWRGRRNLLRFRWRYLFASQVTRSDPRRRVAGLLRFYLILDSSIVAALGAVMAWCWIDPYLNTTPLFLVAWTLGLVMLGRYWFSRRQRPPARRCPPMIVLFRRWSVFDLVILVWLLGWTLSCLLDSNHVFVAVLALCLMALAAEGMRSYLRAG